MSDSDRKTYMVIEHFAPGNVTAIYDRFREHGRMLPAGLHYIDSWLSVDQRRCFQLMETESRELFRQWTQKWDDLARFEIIELGEKPAKRQ